MGSFTFKNIRLQAIYSYYIYIGKHDLECHKTQSLIAEVYNRVHTFKIVWPKANAMEWLKFELFYMDVKVQYVSHYATLPPT